MHGGGATTQTADAMEFYQKNAIQKGVLGLLFGGIHGSGRKCVTVPHFALGKCSLAVLVLIEGGRSTMGSLSRVLLVEDEASIRYVVRVALELEGIDLVECACASDALRVAPEANADFILLDVMLPGTSGVELLQQLRNIPQCASTPVAFLTARTSPSDLAEYRALGVADVIAKPFRPSDLCARLRAVVEAKTA